MTEPAVLSWGAAVPAVQSEGAALPSDWFDWERQGKVPPSFEGNGFALDYADDFGLLRSIGADGVRLTLDWSRLEPADGRPDRAVYDRYRNVLEAARAAGLQCWVVLVDGPLPGWFSIDERGWRDKRARNYFWPRHVEAVADALGGLVDGWVPILRPVSYARAAFVNAAAPPGTRSIQRFVETVQGSYLASYGAWRVLRGGAPVALGVEVGQGRVGEDGAERPTRLYDEVQWAWIDGIRDGIVQLPRLPQERVDDFRNAFDAIAATFDGSFSVGADGRVARSRQNEEFTAAMHRLAERSPDKPIWLIGHSASLGDPTGDAEIAEETVAEIAAVRADGIALDRWVWEPAIDGYEGSAGFDASLGLFDRDRHPKAAAGVLQRWSEARAAAAEAAASVAAAAAEVSPA